jgi:hypothetical protein
MLNQQNWRAPWFNTVCSQAEKFAEFPPSLLELNQAISAPICNAQQQALRFIEQAELPPNTAYEAHIFATGAVPTRRNLHDAFNALVWLNFPHSKAQLNALQAAEIQAHGVGQSRGRVRDALTIFDESVLLLAAPKTEAEQLHKALQQHDWQHVFVRNRTAWGRSIVPFIFGHALLEKMCAPYLNLTAKTVVLSMADEFFTQTLNSQIALLDAASCAWLKALRSPAQLLPLPVAGVPGWWPGNEHADFYENDKVFRRKLEREP